MVSIKDVSLPNPNTYHHTTIPVQTLKNELKIKVFEKSFLKFQFLLCYSTNSREHALSMFELFLRIRVKERFFIFKKKLVCIFKCYFEFFKFTLKYPKEKVRKL
jgi:hypothetical protein